MTKYRILAKDENGELSKLAEADHNSMTAAFLWAEVLKTYYPGIEFEVQPVVEEGEEKMDLSGLADVLKNIEKLGFTQKKILAHNVLLAIAETCPTGGEAEFFYELAEVLTDED